MKIPFNKPYLTGNEAKYIDDACSRGHLSGNGHYSKLCANWLVKTIGCKSAMLTQSCTDALEMAAILAGINPGDEVIMPSYTFVSTANAFVLRGAIPVFVDIRPDTLNIDETKIESAITSKTKAIVPVHYAGVACEMDTIMFIADKHNLIVIEDAAQAIFTKYKGQFLGSIGHLACLSFHETKNIISGEGGALLINNDRLNERAQIIHEKGTNRIEFTRGNVDKYTWVDIGSSFLPSELTAAFLWAQIEESDRIIKARVGLWQNYHCSLEHLEQNSDFRRPIIPRDCIHNGHMYYLLLRDNTQRDSFIARMKEKGINCVFHYVPLHTSPAGQKYSRSGELPVSTDSALRLVRMPLWIGLEKFQSEILEATHSTILELTTRNKPN